MHTVSFQSTSVTINVVGIRDDGICVGEVLIPCAPSIVKGFAFSADPKTRPTYTSPESKKPVDAISYILSTYVPAAAEEDSKLRSGLCFHTQVTTLSDYRGDVMPPGHVCHSFAETTTSGVWVPHSRIRPNSAQATAHSALVITDIQMPSIAQSWSVTTCHTDRSASLPTTVSHSGATASSPPPTQPTLPSQIPTAPKDHKSPKQTEATTPKAKSDATAAAK
jgi:hypothetical protein